jgi:hypothetical protein
MISKILLAKEYNIFQNESSHFQIESTISGAHSSNTTSCAKQTQQQNTTNRPFLATKIPESEGAPTK